MYQVIRKTSFPSQQKSSTIGFSFSNLLSQKLFSVPSPFFYRSFNKRFFSESRFFVNPFYKIDLAFINRGSEDPEIKSNSFETLSWPWMWIDEVDIQIEKSEPILKEKYPDVLDEGFISKKEFNPSNGMEMYDKITIPEDSFFAPEGMTYEEYQTLL